MNFVKFLNDILKVFKHVYYVSYLLLYGSNGSTVTVLLLSQDINSYQRLTSLPATRPGLAGPWEFCPDSPPPPLYKYAKVNLKPKIESINYTNINYTYLMRNVVVIFKTFLKIQKYKKIVKRKLNYEYF